MQGTAGAGHGKNHEQYIVLTTYIITCKEKEKADSNLMFINQQLNLLKEKMLKEQKRLHKLLDKKDRKISCQSIIIQKMRNLIDLQKLKIKTEDFSTLMTEDQFCPGPPGFKTVPTILIEDTNLLGINNLSFQGNIETRNREVKVHPVNLKRQAVVFKKGSERPRIATVSHNPLRSSISCQNLTLISKRTQASSKFKSEKNLPSLTNQSRESLVNHTELTNQGTEPPDIQPLSSDDSGNWSLCSTEKPHTIIRTNSYEKALGLAEHKISSEDKTGFYKLSKFSSQPHLYF